MIISVSGMINLTDYGVSNIVIQVDNNRTYNQENNSDVAVKPEYWVGLAQLRFVEDTEKYYVNAVLVRADCRLLITLKNCHP